MCDKINFGQKIAVVVCDYKKTIFYFACRLIPTALIVFAGFKSNPPSGISLNFISGLLVILLITAVFLWIVLPLLHLKDYIVFYEKGIEICRKRYSLEELGEITFLTVKSTGVFSKKYMQTDIKDFNITYLNNVRKSFNRAYLKTI